jgi:hypothetical protein
MEVIKAEFVPTESASVDYLLGETGVYVLWSGRAVSRPSYIGEGNVLARLVAHDHEKRFGPKLTGVVAVVDGTPAQRKAHAVLLELTLFELAADLEIPPTHNIAPGRWAALAEKYGKGHGVVRFRFSGHHPVRLDTRLPGVQVVEWRYSGPEMNPNLDLVHPWHRSPRRA